jgi:hypothetical protein
MMRISPEGVVGRLMMGFFLGTMGLSFDITLIVTGKDGRVRGKLA